MCFEQICPTSVNSDLELIESLSESVISPQPSHRYSLDRTQKFGSKLLDLHVESRIASDAWKGEQTVTELLDSLPFQHEEEKDCPFTAHLTKRASGSPGSSGSASKGKEPEDPTKVPTRDSRGSKKSGKKRFKIVVV